MSNTGKKWTNKEIEKLKKTIDQHKDDTSLSWPEVATAIKGKTTVQVYNKYRTLCELRKGRFLPEEDAVILACYKRFGANFNIIADHLPGRSATQCRVRYKILGINSSIVWTTAEDKKLSQLMANQDEPISNVSLTKYFPGKSRIHIRSRRLTLAKWMEKNPYLDISKAPRRRSRQLKRGTMPKDLEDGLVRLKQRLQSEINDENNKKITENSSEDVIEAAIAAVYNECKKKDVIEYENLYKSEEMVPSPSYKPNINTLQKLLLLLQVKLNKRKFVKSPLSLQYRQLIKPFKEDLSIKLKSYSKKQTLQENAATGEKHAIDIWGGGTLGKITHVLPPNYSTIIGCKKLLSYLNYNPQQKELQNFEVVLRKNSLLKKQFQMINERLKMLFMWPLLLKNSSPRPSLLKLGDSPSEPREQNPSNKVRRVKSHFSFDEYHPGITIPLNMSDDVNDSIDLVKSSTTPDVNVKPLTFEFQK